MWVGKPINYTSQEVIGSSVFDVWNLGYILDFHIEEAEFRNKTKLRERDLGRRYCFGSHCHIDGMENHEMELRHKRKFSKTKP